MSTAATPAPSASASFLRDKLGSLLGLLPLGVWTVGHLWNNLSAFRGPAAWQSAVTEYSNPFAHALTMAIVLLPLAWHIYWGTKRVVSSRPNNGHYNTFANLRYLLQRLSAVGVLLFLGAHLWLAMLEPRLVQGHGEAFADIAHEMHHHTPTLLVYLLGTLGVAYHLANGIASSAMGFGFIASRSALKRFDAFAMLLLALFLAMSWGAIYALYQAGA